MESVLCQANRETLFNDSRRKSCWLPSDGHPWNYCRHCSFTQKDQVIDSLLRNLEQGTDEMDMPSGQKERLLTIVQYPWFRHHCAHPASRLRLYHLMILLRTKNKDIYTTYLRDPNLVLSFSGILQNHRPQAHNPTSCSLICDLAVHDVHQVPRQCPHCLYRLMKAHPQTREYYTSFIAYLREYERKPYHFPFPHSIMKDIVRISIERDDQNRQYALSVMYGYYRRQNAATADERFYEFLQDFLMEATDTFGKVVASDSHGLMSYCPEWLTQQELQVYVIEPARLHWKQLMKVRCDTYKEDLMIKTCHPSRLFHWIFDIDDLKDFEPYEEERDLRDLFRVEPPRNGE